MLDINFIRENLDLVKDGARKKHMNVDFSKLIKLDDARRELLQKVERMRAEQNEVTKQIASSEQSQRELLISKMQQLKEELRKYEEELKDVMKK